MNFKILNFEIKNAIDGLIWMIGSAILFLSVGLAIDMVTGHGDLVILLAPLGSLLGLIIGTIRSLKKDALQEEEA